MPDPTGRTADLSLDLPVTVGTHQTLMQLQIHRDQHNEAESAAERGWQLRFALNLPDMGEVGAQVTLRAGSVGVMLWATEPAASAALDAEIGALREALAGAGLQPGAVLVRHGEPPAAPAAASGHFVDSRT
ncbi:flagellar hook-length control protein FliK [Devosia ginsengisoli]|uniref:flagellar hook-length control protein FliK n=1 Tax=Devosia ginsengisoli TaxID=400770 RepID=UPI0026F2E786|nr:flagellar hook-length control protein FliK [Devosia ginsengisoli]MCR6672746.1 flagellar hook-length control protein FliK [Devosia ginsengisoli]